MLIRLLRSLRGYVRFEILSPYPERFINLSVRKRIPIWDTARTSDGVYASMYNRDYKRVRASARAAKARLHITERRGLPVFVRKHRGRVGVALGMLVFVLTVFLMSQFIWSIELSGLERISQSELMEDLKEQGLYVGAFKPSLDFGEVARNVMIKNKDVGWMAVNVTGSYASVELKEEQLPPEVEDVYTPCNIKASRDGVIVKTQVREGELLLSEGSGVVQDQLLVSGVLQDALGGTSFVHCDAKILADTVRKQTFTLKADGEILSPETESRERQNLDFLGFEIPLMFVAPSAVQYACRSEQECLRFLEVSIPVGVTRERLRGFTVGERAADEAKAETILHKNSDLYEAFCLPDCEISGRDYDLSFSDGVYRLDVTYHCIEDIAVQSPIYLENIDAPSASTEP